MSAIFLTSFVWLVNADGILRTALARRTAKSWYVKLAVDNIIHTGSIKAQVAVLCAVTDHSSLVAVCELARISL